MFGKIGGFNVHLVVVMTGILRPDRDLASPEVRNDRSVIAPNFCDIFQGNKFVVGFLSVAVLINDMDVDLEQFLSCSRRRPQRNGHVKRFSKP